MTAFTDSNRPVTLVTSPCDPTQVFIIRVWREPREIEGQPALWRGVIEHLVSGERCYFTRYSKLIVFMLDHLPRAALQLDLPLRLLPLMHRLTQRFRANS